MMKRENFEPVRSFPLQLGIGRHQLFGSRTVKDDLQRSDIVLKRTVDVVESKADDDKIGLVLEYVTLHATKRSLRGPPRSGDAIGEEEAPLPHSTVSSRCVGVRPPDRSPTGAETAQRNRSLL